MDPVALYAAVLSTVTTLLTVRGWWRSRNPFYMSLEPHYLYSTPSDDGEGYYQVRVANRSSAPITVQSYGIGFDVDWQRIPHQVIGNSGPAVGFDSGKLRLDVYESVESMEPQEYVEGLLHPPLVNTPIREDNGEWVDDWSGGIPSRMSYLWAIDIADRMYKVRLDSFWRTVGYETWRPDVPPVVRGRVAAAWLRVCMAVYNNRRATRLGPRVVNALHRRGLFPVELPPW